MPMTAISVDRLALLLGLRYKKIVTLKCTNISFAGVSFYQESLSYAIFQITL